MRYPIRPAAAADAPAVAAIYVESSNERFAGFFPHRDLTADLVARWEGDLVAGIRSTLR